MLEKCLSRFLSLNSELPWPVHSHILSINHNTICSHDVNKTDRMQGVEFLGYVVMTTMNVNRTKLGAVISTGDISTQC